MFMLFTPDTQQFLQCQMPADCERTQDVFATTAICYDVNRK
jgi:hypothetical protein